MTYGLVKFFDPRKGYGFLNVEGLGVDIFVHYTRIDGRGFRSLVKGERVRLEFDHGGPDGRARATRVMRSELRPTQTRPTMRR